MIRLSLSSFYCLQKPKLPSTFLIQSIIGVENRSSYFNFGNGTLRFSNYSSSNNNNSNNTNNIRLNSKVETISLSKRENSNRIKKQKNIFNQTVNEDADHFDRSKLLKEDEDEDSSKEITNEKIDRQKKKIEDLLNKTERLQKRLSRAGVTSRRNAEKLIQEGRVSVNGKVATLKDSLLVTESCEIKVDGKILKESMPKVWIHNKLKKVLVTNVEDPERDTLIPILKKILGKSHLISVGRLDYYSEGLILLTNDGELARYLELPESGFEKTYRVRIFGKITPNMHLALTKGIVVDGIKYAPMKLQIERETESNTWVQCTLTEGKNREIRKIFEHFNVKVLRIIRTKFGPYTLPPTLKPGETQEVMIKDEIKSFKQKWIAKEKVKKQLLSIENNNNNSSDNNSSENK